MVAFLYSTVMNIPKFIKLKALKPHLLLGYLKHILMALLSHLSLPNTANTVVVLEQYPTTTPSSLEEYEFRWSSSLIPLPLYYMTDSIKNKLPVMEYSSFLLQKKKLGADHDPQCVVCLNPMEATHYVRELCNCCHVFHKECLDAWIDKCNVTCPLCRAELLPASAARDQPEELKKCRGGEHPWRAARTIYSFGED